jgi:drug/metabolite transporter (DMT)-like permease
MLSLDCAQLQRALPSSRIGIAPEKVAYDTAPGASRADEPPVIFNATPRRTAMIALVLLTLIWSYNWIVLKQVLRFVGPFDFSALRYAFGTLVLFAALIARRESLKPPPLAMTMLIGFAQTAGFQALVQWALVNGAAGKTALLAYTMPFWVVLFAWIALGDRPGVRQWLSLAGAAVGLVVVVEPWRGLGGAGSAALAIGGGACWAIGVVLSKRLFQRCGVSALSLTAWQMLFGALLLIAIALIVPQRPIEWTPFLLGALVYNAVLSSGLAWLMWSYVVERLPANIAGLSSLVIPIAGIAFAWLLLGEKPTAVESLGIVTICASLGFVNFRREAKAA